MKRLQQDNGEPRKDIRRLKANVWQLTAMLAGRFDSPAPATKEKPASFSAAVKGPPKPSVPRLDTRKTLRPKTGQVPPKMPVLVAPLSPSSAPSGPSSALPGQESRKRCRGESEGEETIIIEVTGMETDTPYPEKVGKIPPINIQGQTSWIQLNGAFTAEGIKVHHQLEGIPPKRKFPVVRKEGRKTKEKSKKTSPAVDRDSLEVK